MNPAFFFGIETGRCLLTCLSIVRADLLGYGEGIFVEAL